MSTTRTRPDGSAAFLACLFLMGLAHAIVSACLFRILAFDFVSPAFFLLYAGVGTPLGAFAAHRYLAGSPRALPWAVGLAALSALLLPLVAVLATRGPDLVHETFFDGALSGSSVALHLTWSLLLATPTFAAWGASELVGFRLATASTAARPVFYLLFAWALLASLPLTHLALPVMGWLRTLALGPLAAAFAAAFLPDGAAPGSRPRLMVACLAVCLLLAGAGGREEDFLRLVVPDAPHRSTNALAGGDVLTGRPREAPPPVAVVASTFGRYCHLQLLSSTDAAGRPLLLGYHDGILLWFTGTEPPPDLTDGLVDPSLLPPFGDVCIIGAGGGRQVLTGLRRCPDRRFTAIDVIPEIFDLLRGPGAAASGHVYENPRVRTLAGDGRRILADSDETYGAILLPHTESISAQTRTLFEPGVSLHSTEAFTLMRRRLAPGGFVAVAKGVDRDGALFRTYGATMRSAGFHTVGWVQRPGTNPLLPGHNAFLLVGGLDASTPAVGAVRTWDWLGAAGFDFRDFADSPEGLPPPLTDDSPWSRSVMGLVVPPPVFLQAAAAATVATAAGLLVLTCWAVPSRRWWSTGRVVLASFMTGLNYVTLENALVLWLLRHLMNPLAAFVAGAALFLALWGPSSVATNRTGTGALVVVVAAAVLSFAGHWSGLAGLTLVLVLVMGSAACFPRLVLKAPDDLPRVISADALGALVGGLVCVALPLLMGTGHLFALVPVIPVLTHLATWRATGPGGEP